MALPLRLALMANAIFSLISGLATIIYPTSLGQWLGIHAPLVLQVVGAGLVIFAVDLIHQATRFRIATWRGLYASTADFVWVIGSIALVVFFPAVLSAAGNVAVLTIAAAVFTLGACQLWAIGHAHKIPGSDEYRHCMIVEVNVPAEAMWRVISNLGDIKKYMPLLRHSAILGERTPGVGAVRVCEDHSGKQWAEECTEFNPGRNFVVRFLSEAPDFPFPAKAMRGGWEVGPSRIGSHVMVWWELTPKQKLLVPVILPLLAWQADRDFPKVVQRMAAGTLGALRGGDARPSTRVIARLLPNLC